MTSIFERLEQEWGHTEHAIATRIPHHHDTSAETPAAPATIEPAAQEEHVSTLTDVTTAFDEGLAKLRTLDADAMEKVTTIKATPEGALLFEALHELVAAEVPAGTLQTLTGIVKSVVSLIPAQPQAPAAPSFTPAPAGPQVGGQA